jgi:hypothetical protein
MVHLGIYPPFSTPRAIFIFIGTGRHLHGRFAGLLLLHIILPALPPSFPPSLLPLLLLLLLFLVYWSP